MTTPGDNTPAAGSPEAVAAAAAAALAAAGGPKPWYDGAPPEIVAHLQAHGWDKKPEKEVALAAAQSHFAASKLIGVPENELARIPKPGDTEGWNKFYEKLGVPKDAAAYKFEGLKFKDGTLPDKSFTDWLAAQAASLKLTQNAAQQMAQETMKHMDAVEADELAVKQANVNADREALKKNWGPNFDAKLFIAQRAAAALGVSKEAIAALQEHEKYGVVMEMFANIAAKIGEDKIVLGEGGGPNQDQFMSQSQAANRKAELMSDPAWKERYLAGYKKELAEMIALSTILTATKQAA